jgi:hypothetical protein
LEGRRNLLLGDFVVAHAVEYYHEASKGYC